MEIVMKTVNLSFFNPDSVPVDLTEISFLNDVSFTEETRVLSFKSGDVMQQIQLPLAEEDNLIDISIDNGELKLVTDSSSIVVGDVRWEDQPTLDAPGTGVLDEDGSFYPLTGINGITITEAEDNVVVDYDSEVTVDTNKVGQAAVYIPTPVVGTTYQLKLLTLSDTNTWFVLPLNYVDDRQSMGLALGPNGGLLLPPGTYELNARFSVYGCGAFAIKIHDATNEIARSATEWSRNFSDATGGEQYAEVQGHYRCTVETEVFISGIGNFSYSNPGPRFGRTGRWTAAWPTNPRMATLDIFKIDDYVGDIPIQPQITPLLDNATGYDNTQYVVTASSEYSTTYRAWYALSDVAAEQAWAAAAGSVDPWVQIGIKSAPIVANALMFSNRSDNVVGDYYNRACRVLYKPDDLSDWLVAAETSDMPRHFGATTLILFDQYLTIKQLRVVITDSLGSQTMRALQLLDFQQPII